AEDGIRDFHVTGVQTCALPIFPIFASTMALEFGQEADGYGVLSSILAIGSLAGALLAARRDRARVRVLIFAAGGFGAASIVSARSEARRVGRWCGARAPPVRGM